VDLLGVQEEAVFRAAQSRENPPLGGHDLLDAAGKTLAIHVAQADCIGTADLIAIAGADAAHRGADGLAARGFVHQAVFLEVPGKNHVGTRADHEILGNLDAASDEALDFLQQAGRIDDHAGGNDALHLGPEDSAGHQRELEGLPIHDHGMAGVGPALVAHDDIVPLGEKIDNLPLGFVPPLQPYDTCAGMTCFRSRNSARPRKAPRPQANIPV